MLYKVLWYRCIKNKPKHKNFLGILNWDKNNNLRDNKKFQNVKEQDMVVIMIQILLAIICYHNNKIN